MDGDSAPRDRAVLKRAPHQARRDDRPAVVRETRRPGTRELGHLRQLAPLLRAGDGGEEPDRDLGLPFRGLGEGAEHGGGVDDGLGVRHRQDRAVAAGRRGRGSRGDRLLVLAAGRPEVDVRVDERRRQHQRFGFDDAMCVRVEPRTKLRDPPAVDADVHDGVDAFGRVDHACAADDDVLLAAFPEQHHAAPSSCRAPACTAAGPWVSRS